MTRHNFFITGSIILAGGFVWKLAALGSDLSLPNQNSIRIASSPFAVRTITHETPLEAEWAARSPSATEIPAEAELETAPTRSSFIASWPKVSGAIGYRLDVSTSASFDSYVNGHCDLDVGNVTGHPVTGLSQGTTYYYQVRAYDAVGAIIGMSEAMSVKTVTITGLIIHPTFDNSITGNQNAAAIEAMINRAISIYESLFSDPITIKIRFRYSTTLPDGTPFPAGALAYSLGVAYHVPWNTFINALRADAKSSNDDLANASLPGAALSTNIITKSPNGRALSLNTPTAMFADGHIAQGGPYDGIVTLNSSAPFQFNRPTNAGNVDAQRGIEHEMDEIIGLGSYLGHNVNDLLPQDLFSWSSPGVRNITSSGTRHFSIDGGVHNIVTFNQNPQGDFGDWLSASCPQVHPYVQNAFGCAGQSSDIAAGSPEGRNLDIIGYDSAHSIVTTNASNVTSSSAILNGTVNPGGLPTSVHFQYGTTTSYGSNTTTQSYNGSTIQNVTANITGLSPSTVYHFRLVGTNSHGTSYGSDKTFTTPSAIGRPLVITSSPTNRAAFSATLKGSVYPHGLTTTVYFQYGLTTTYGSTTASQTKTGNTYQSVSANISGLTASTTYHFRIVATNSAGTTYGADRTFTTLSATGTPVVTTNPATNVATSSATLNGTVDPHGLSTSVHFQYGTTTSYGSTTANQTHVGNTYLNISANISGLNASATYHFRIVATNSAGTRYGSDRTFATVPPDESVAWQNNAVHDGFDPTSPLVPPLTLKWSRDLSGSGVRSISYPLIARGLVFITTTTMNNYGTTLMAFNEHTGTTVWSRAISGTYFFSNAAYDSGKVFVVNFDGLLKAFDAASGTLLWSVSLPGQYAFTSPPTAANGTVFIGGAGSGGTVYAVNETNGAVLWTMPVENGDHSSPAVIQGSVFVSYACPQAYAFSTATGQELWNYSGGCEGGGGATPVVHAGQVYVRDSFGTPTNGLVLNASTGALIRGFDSDRPPAFFNNLALFLQSGTLRGVNSQNGQVLWSFAGDGDLTSAPVVVNQTIYIGSNSGTLYGLNASGQQIWSTQVGAAIPAPDEFNATLTTGLGAGDGLLIVPTASVLVAYGN